MSLAGARRSSASTEQRLWRMRLAPPGLGSWGVGDAYEGMRPEQRTAGSPPLDSGSLGGGWWVEGPAVFERLLLSLFCQLWRR